MKPEVLQQSAESQVINLLRGEDTAEFDLRVSVRAGHWLRRLLQTRRLSRLIHIRWNPL